MILISFIILVLYFLLMLAFIIGFDKVENFKSPTLSPKTKFSIIVPFRNEVDSLKSLLESISMMNYPSELFEIWFIDDDSNDNSVMIIENFIRENKKLHIKVLANKHKSDSPKKDAIYTAIVKANFEWMITTDADCIIPKNWLNIFDAYIQKHQSKLIAAPVTYQTQRTLLEQFQLLDFLSLQASTIGSFGIHKPFLCNGANLCYEKKAFMKVNGFEGNENIASGDDVFLLQKMVKKYPDKVHFLKSKEAIVKTNPQKSLKDLLSQRIRWAAKTTAYKSNFAKFVGITVLLMNLMVVLTLITAMFNLLQWKLAFIIIIIKFILDYILLNKIYRFYNQKFLFQYYLIGGFLYPFFSLFVAIVSFRTTYHWKGRKFNK